jgi:nicotinate-nucleotide adenylyltransferase
MRIGVCGGTFDPFHRGHLEPLLAARKEIGWDRVLYVPASRQPFKSGQPLTSGYHRFAIAQLATREHDAIFVTPMELERGGTSFTVDTLEELHREHPGAQIDWIIGNDNVADLQRWKDPERLFELARFVVLSRQAEAQPGPANLVRNLVFIHNPIVPISATEIRRRVGAGEPIDALVDPLVSRYIHHYGLYKESQT